MTPILRVSMRLEIRSQKIAPNNSFEFLSHFLCLVGAKERNLSRRIISEMFTVRPSKSDFLTYWTPRRQYRNPLGCANVYYYHRLWSIVICLQKMEMLDSVHRTYGQNTHRADTLPILYMLYSKGYTL